MIQKIDALLEDKIYTLTPALVSAPHDYQKINCHIRKTNIKYTHVYDQNFPSFLLYDDLSIQLILITDLTSNYVQVHWGLSTKRVSQNIHKNSQNYNSASNKL